MWVWQRTSSTQLHQCRWLVVAGTRHFWETQPHSVQDTTTIATEARSMSHLDMVPSCEP
jgi:hypothetical protein